MFAIKLYFQHADGLLYDRKVWLQVRPLHAWWRLDVLHLARRLWCAGLKWSWRGTKWLTWCRLCTIEVVSLLCVRIYVDLVITSFRRVTLMRSSLRRLVISAAGTPFCVRIWLSELQILILLFLFYSLLWRYIFLAIGRPTQELILEASVFLCRFVHFTILRYPFCLLFSSLLLFKKCVFRSIVLDICSLIWVLLWLSFKYLV